MIHHGPFDPTIHLRRHAASEPNFHTPCSMSLERQSRSLQHSPRGICFGSRSGDKFLHKRSSETWKPVSGFRGHQRRCTGLKIKTFRGFTSQQAIHSFNYPPTNKPTNQSTNQPINQPASKPITQLTKQATSKPTN
ncbi:hypothetical protein BsWGS_05111 [Bradybaena similaris]